MHLNKYGAQCTVYKNFPTDSAPHTARSDSRDLIGALIDQSVMKHSKHSSFSFFLLLPFPFVILSPAFLPPHTMAIEINTTVPTTSPSPYSAARLFPHSLQQRCNQRPKVEDNIEIKALHHWRWHSSTHCHHLRRAQQAPPGLFEGWIANDLQ